jgi:putative DNA primase/helicase
MQLGEFLSRGFSIDKPLLGAMILAKSIGMIAGPRGGGKSWLCLLMIYSIAGAKLLEPWDQGSGAAVAYLDGEMRAASLQDRLRSLHAHNSRPESIELVEKNLYIISRDCIGSTIGTIDTEEGQKNIDALIPSRVKIIVIDNLSAWTSGGREDSAAWAMIKTWLIGKRLQGVAVLLIHHAGKNGQQRGSSAHEDLLDYSILLSPLPSNQERQDTRFLVEHTKLRDYIPALRKRYEYSVWTEDGELKFECVPAGFDISANAAEMVRLRDEKVPFAEIGRRMGVSKSTVSRTLKKLREQSADDEGVETS